MIRVVLFFLNLFLCSYAIAQVQTLSGLVYSKDKLLLPSATVTLHKKNEPAIIAFAIADQNGYFEISFSPENTDSLELKASMLGYSSQRLMLVPGGRKSFEFVLIPREITLPEVKTKNNPVWQRKDTINYSVASFKQQQDRVIGDIIARLPGIEITPSGQIKYLGKPINKYYIEGLDLLEDRYSIANNNLPAYAVDKIQVLENHQPIRMLDSLSFSDRAALNISLKNSAKTRLIGQARLGIGIEPTLTENELVAMLFKRKAQSINTYKFNNTGVDNRKELSAHNMSDYVNATQSGGLRNEILTLAEPGEPPLAKNRYLFNSAHTASVNLLVPLDSIYQLRINSSFVNDYQRVENSVNSSIFLPLDTIVFFEQANNRKGVNLLQTDFTILANSPRYYLKNLSHFQGWWQQDRGILANNNNAIDQRLNSQFCNVSNDFRLIKTRKRNILEWSSYFGYSAQPQQLLVYPGLYNDLLANGSTYDAVLQKLKVNVFYTDNAFSIRRRKGKVNTTFRIGTNWQNKRFQSYIFTSLSDVFKSTPDSFSNNLRWNRIGIYSENSIVYESGPLRFTITVPVSLISIQYSNSNKPVIRKNGVIVMPNLSMMLQLSPKWNWGNSFSYTNRNFGEAEQVAPGYILKTYRNFSGSNSPLSEHSYIGISSYVNFRDPLKTIFFSGGVNYANYAGNILYEQNYNGSLETLLATLLNNTNSSLSFFSRLNKYIISWKSSFTVNAGYSLNKIQQFQQGQLSNFANRSLTFGIGANTKLSSKITADYSATGNKRLTNPNGKSSRPPIYSATQNFTFNFFPGLKWMFRFTGEHFYLKIPSNKQEQNYFFADFAIRLKPKKSKIDWEFITQNLFNTKQFLAAVNTNNTEIISAYQLRPRQVLLKAGFRLN